MLSITVMSDLSSYPTDLVVSGELMDGARHTHRGSPTLFSQFQVLRVQPSFLCNPERIIAFGSRLCDVCLSLLLYCVELIGRNVRARQCDTQESEQAYTPLRRQLALSS